MKKIDEKHSTIGLIQSREYHAQIAEPKEDDYYAERTPKQKHRLNRHYQAVAAAQKLLGKRGYK